jgi:tetratricopeptide (TPR) repeat protein
VRAILPYLLGLFCLLQLLACGEKLTDQERLERFRAMVQAGDYEKARKEFRNLIIDFPTDSVALYYGAKTFLELGVPDSATSYAKKLTSLYYKHIDGYQLLYDAAGLAEDYEAQLWAVSQMGYYARDRRRYYNEIAELNFKLGKYGMTIGTCNTILEYDPDNLRIMFILGSSLASGGQFDSAIKVMERIDRLYPGNMEVLSNLGSYLAEVGRYNEAEIKFLEIVRADPDFIPGWYGLGNVSLEIGDTADAIEAYREVYERDSTFLGVDSILRGIDPTLLPDSTGFIEPNFKG